MCLGALHRLPGMNRPCNGADCSGDGAKRACCTNQIVTTIFVFALAAAGIGVILEVSDPGECGDYCVEQACSALPCRCGSMCSEKERSSLGDVGYLFDVMGSIFLIFFCGRCCCCSKYDENIDGEIERRANAANGQTASTAPRFQGRGQPPPSAEYIRAQQAAEDRMNQQRGEMMSVTPPQSQQAVNQRATEIDELTLRALGVSNAPPPAYTSSSSSDAPSAAHPAFTGIQPDAYGVPPQTRAPRNSYPNPNVPAYAHGTYPGPRTRTQTQYTDDMSAYANMQSNQRRQYYQQHVQLQQQQQPQQAYPPQYNRQQYVQQPQYAYVNVPMAALPAMPVFLQTVAQQFSMNAAVTLVHPHEYSQASLSTAQQNRTQAAQPRPQQVYVSVGQDSIAVVPVSVAASASASANIQSDLQPSANAQTHIQMQANTGEGEVEATATKHQNHSPHTPSEPTAQASKAYTQPSQNGEGANAGGASVSQCVEVAVSEGGPEQEQNEKHE